MSATLIPAPVAMGLLVSHAPRCNCLTCRPCAVIDLREAQARAAAIKYYETRDSTHGQRSLKSVFKRISKTMSRSASPTPSVEEPPMGMGSFGSVYEALDDPFAA
ncbi:hypothetical protein CYLTODRAFT_455081 [Cylindrobasidium torrendii FP15055 ss-10]|uniref:Uncharacterized protein n=1 Tax=Cylindrobasidium torrendii FP15055 ss-10 TaxID=1314674 RepID=A0A0D7B9C4_9AGAR|nr:hypothetical protein CYLTODRAFT_455081 [Cylindrobasidium torrendii FP15055 ss-10]